MDSWIRDVGCCFGQSSCLQPRTRSVASHERWSTEKNFGREKGRTVWERARCEMLCLYPGSLEAVVTLTFNFFYFFFFFFLVLTSRAAL